jgi:hypothetical protein
MEYGGVPREIHRQLAVNSFERLIPEESKNPSMCRAFRGAWTTGGPLPSLMERLT